MKEIKRLKEVKEVKEGQVKDWKVQCTETESKIKLNTFLRYDLKDVTPEETKGSFQRMPCNFKLKPRLRQRSRVKKRVRQRV